MGEKPLMPWIIVEPSGEVLSAHCDCMVGLGECCSHVTLFLWAVESRVCIRDSVTGILGYSQWCRGGAVCSR